MQGPNLLAWVLHHWFAYSNILHKNVVGEYSLKVVRLAVPSASSQGESVPHTFLKDRARLKQSVSIQTNSKSNGRTVH